MTTSQEDNLIGRQSHRKICSQEDDFTGRKKFTGRGTHRKMNSQEEELGTAQPQFVSYYSHHYNNFQCLWDKIAHLRIQIDFLSQKFCKMLMQQISSVSCDRKQLFRVKTHLLSKMNCQLLFSVCLSSLP